MFGKSEGIWLTIKSTTSLLVSFIILLLLRWGLVLIGILISNFPGKVIIALNTVNTFSDTWQLKHVLWIYLFPYLSIVFIYFVFFNKDRIYKRLPDWFHLFFGWSHILILTFVFFLPFCEISSRTGIYYPLSWLYLNRAEQFIFGVILMILLVLKVFRVSFVFSFILKVPSNKFLNSSIIIRQLPFLWYFPLLICWVLNILFTNDFSFQSNILFIGALGIIIVNSLLIVRYKVIIK